MGVLPLQFLPAEDAASLGLPGEETFTINGVSNADEKTGELEVRAEGKTFRVKVRIDTPTEAAYFRHGGILRTRKVDARGVGTSQLTQAGLTGASALIKTFRTCGT